MVVWFWVLVYFAVRCGLCKAGVLVVGLVVGLIWFALGLWRAALIVGGYDFVLVCLVADCRWFAVVLGWLVVAVGCVG